MKEGELMEYSKFDIVDYLDSDEAAAAYLSAVLEEKDPDLLAAALGDIARAGSMSKPAQDA